MIFLNLPSDTNGSFVSCYCKVMIKLLCNKVFTTLCWFFAAIYTLAITGDNTENWHRNWDLAPLGKDYFIPKFFHWVTKNQQ